MTEFVYPLNLPPLADILLDSAGLFSTSSDFCKYAPQDILKPEWCHWEGLNWDFSLFFQKTDGKTGMIHVDGPVWGINWIHNGHGTLEFWNPKDVDMVLETTELGTPRYKCSTTVAPSKIYTTVPGAYLVNASAPHRATGFDKRYALSVRSYSSKLSWESAVTKFQKYIGRP
jgi:hypothetical protein